MIRNFIVFFDSFPAGKFRGGIGTRRISVHPSQRSARADRRRKGSGSDAMVFQRSEGMRGAAGLGSFSRRTKTPGLMDEVFHDDRQAPFALDSNRYERRVPRAPHPGTSTRPFGLSTDAPLARDEISKISNFGQRMPTRKLRAGAAQSTASPWSKGGKGQDVGTGGVYTGVESVYLDRIRSCVIDPNANRKYGDDSFKFPSDREDGGFIFRSTLSGRSDRHKFQGVEMRYKTAEGRERMRNWTMRPWERDDSLVKEAARRSLVPPRTAVPRTPGLQGSVTPGGIRRGTNSGGGFQPSPRRPVSSDTLAPARVQSPFATSFDHPTSVRASPGGYHLSMINRKADTFCP